ncbi:MAG TPA: hypothetical protein VII29_07280 [Terriglobales bacterium]
MEEKKYMIGINGTLRLLCTFFALLTAAGFAVAQEPLPGAQPVDVTGHWIISAKNWNGEPNTKTVDLQQKGSEITGHFKGPDQSGGLQGSVNGHHIMFRTKTRTPLTFRGQVEGDTMTGTYNVKGKKGEFHAERTAAE